MLATQSRCFQRSCALVSVVFILLEALPGLSLPTFAEKRKGAPTGGRVANTTVMLHFGYRVVTSCILRQPSESVHLRDRAGPSFPLYPMDFDCRSAGVRGMCRFSHGQRC